MIPRPAEFVERLELAGCNLVLFESVRRGEVGAHVADERFRNGGRQIDRLVGHGLKIGISGEISTQYAEAATGNREYFLNKQCSIGGSRKDIP